MKLFQVPIDHPYIQNLTQYDLAFIEMSTALDDPKFRAKVENMYVDDEFDEFWNNPDSDEWDEEFEEHSEETLQPEQPESGQYGEEPIDYGSFINQEKNLLYEQNNDNDDDYAYIPDESSEEINDWEVVDDE